MIQSAEIQTQPKGRQFDEGMASEVFRMLDKMLWDAEYGTDQQPTVQQWAQNITPYVSDLRWLGQRWELTGVDIRMADDSEVYVRVIQTHEVFSNIMVCTNLNDIRIIRCLDSYQAATRAVGSIFQIMIPRFNAHQEV